MNAAKGKKQKSVGGALLAWFALGLLLFAASGYLLGGRFDPLKAALRHPSLTRESMLLGEHSSKRRRVYVFQNPDYYYTVMTAYRFPFWRADRRVTYAYRNGDAVQLLGWYQENNRLNTMTVIPVRSNDPAVERFVMGRDRAERDSETGDVVFFYWDRVVRWSELEGQAQSVDREVLYRLDYDDFGRSTTAMDIHWYPESAGG